MTLKLIIKSFLFLILFCILKVLQLIVICSCFSSMFYATVLSAFFGVASATVLSLNVLKLGTFCLGLMRL